LETRFFLGANSSSGFYFLFDDFVSAENGDFLWVIKDGPGCGKSALMKKIGSAAANAGIDVEYIHCSGDPDELDGIYIPSLKTGYVDGTSPHVFEAKYPAASGLYLDLDIFYDIGELRQRLPDIMEKSKEYGALKNRASSLICAAEAVSPISYPGLADEKDIATVLRRADGVISREIPKKTPSGPETQSKKRFLSALTHKGRVFFEGTVSSYCERIYGLDNALGLADTFISHIARALKTRGVGHIVCPDPINPGRLEALLIPELSLGFLAAEPGCEYEGDPYRHIRLDAITDNERVRPMRSKLRKAGKLQGELMSNATAALSDAKKVSDELRDIYLPCMDTYGLDTLADIHISRLLSL
jgi:hypothetical protein